MGEISKLGWLIGFFKHTVWASLLSFLYLLLLFNFQNPGFIPAYCLALSMIYWASFDFSRRLSQIVPIHIRSLQMLYVYQITFMFYPLLYNFRHCLISIKKDAVTQMGLRGVQYCIWT
jgi:hypothetical protein